MGLLLVLIVLFACRRRYHYGPYWNQCYGRGYPPYYGDPYYGPYYHRGPVSEWHPYYGYSQGYGYRPYRW